MGPKKKDFSQGFKDRGISWNDQNQANATGSSQTRGAAWIMKALLEMKAKWQQVSFLSEFVKKHRVITGILMEVLLWIQDLTRKCVFMIICTFVSVCVCVCQTNGHL